MPIDDGQSGTFKKISQDKIQRYRLVNLMWPLQSVAITSPFGFRNGERHEGLDLRAPSGTPVYAAHAGVVLYSGNGISGYGNMVIVKHSSGLATVYAHHSKNLVHRGMRVEQGDRIAYSGSTGHSSGPHLHFEVRDGSDPFDPRLILPSTNAQERRALLARAPSAKPSESKSRTSRVHVASTQPRSQHHRIARRHDSSARPTSSKKHALTRSEIREVAKRRALERVKLAQRRSI